MTDTTVKPGDLARFVPLNALTQDNLKEIAQKSRIVELAGGRYLFRDDKRPTAHLFLLEGEVELLGEQGVDKSIAAGSAEASQSLDQVLPSASAAKAKGDVVAIAVDRDLLDLMLTWSQSGNYQVEDLSSDRTSTHDENDWMTHLLQTECFRRIPPANIQAIFMRMEPVAFKSGDKVITQGEAGDYFYIIREGRCLVTRTTRARPDGVRLAELGPGDSFGEEALISNKARNATVTMLKSGTLMRMSKEDFTSLLNEPLLEQIAFDEAVKLTRAGARWIDVRLPPEFEGGHIKGATNIPLVMLRKRAESLDPEARYIVYCDTGSRSSAASYLLSERGFEARVLKEGMKSVPPGALAKGAG